MITQWIISGKKKVHLMHENHPSKQKVKSDEVNLQSITLEDNAASARFPQGDNYGHKIIIPVTVNKREGERFTNKSGNVPTRTPQGGVLLLITLPVSSNEARSAAEQYP